MTVNLNALAKCLWRTPFTLNAGIGFVNNCGGLTRSTVGYRYCSNRLASISASALSCDNRGRSDCPISLGVSLGFGIARRSSSDHKSEGHYRSEYCSYYFACFHDVAPISARGGPLMEKSHYHP